MNQDNYDPSFIADHPFPAPSPTMMTTSLRSPSTMVAAQPATSPPSFSSSSSLSPRSPSASSPSSAATHGFLRPSAIPKLPPFIMLRSKSSKPSSPATATATTVGEWEVRPGGMLVQKHNPDDGAGAGAAAFPPILNIRVRVKHGSAYLDVYLSPQSTFGELKKLLSERTGLHPLDQKLVYKGKDRDSSAYLDISGVKDRSKMVLLEDSTAQAKRFLEIVERDLIIILWSKQDCRTT